MSLKILKLLLLALLILNVSCSNDNSTPLAGNGEMDIESWDFEKSGSFYIKGKWAVVWNKLVRPEDISKKFHSMKKEYVSASIGWRDEKEEAHKSYSLDSAATFILKLKNIKELKDDSVSLSLSTSINEYDLYVLQKGKLISKPVITNTMVSQAEAGQLFKRSHLVNLEASPETYLVFHVSKFYGFSKGFLPIIKIGLTNDIKTRYLRHIFRDAFLIGVFWVLALFHLGVYMTRKKSNANLYFGLFCVLSIAHFVFLEKYIHYFVTVNSINIFRLFNKFEFITFYLSFPLVYSIVNSFFPNDFNKGIKKSVWGVSIAFALVTSFIKYEWYSQVAFIYQFMLLSVCGYMFFKLSKLIYQKKSVAYLQTSAIGLLLFVYFYEVLYSYQIAYSFSYLLLGYVLYALSQSLINIRVFNLELKNTEKENTTLKKKVNKRTNDLKNKNELIEDLHLQRENFFNSVSYELRTPITLILNSIESVKSIVSKNTDLDQIFLNAKRLLRLVNQLLDFQRISEQKHHMNLAPLDLVVFLKSCGQYFKALCEKKNISFELDVGNIKEAYILGEIDALEKVVFNYLMNALKFSPEGGYIVLLLEVDDERAKISIMDSGTGVKDEEQDKLFKVFTKIKTADNNNYEGAGIGLAVVKELAEEMNGKVGARSELHVGSTFWAEFPIVRNPSQIIDLLIVDDDPDQRDILEFTVKSKSKISTYEVKSNAKEARDIISNYTVKCVLSDAVMPGEDGMDFLKYVGEVQPKSQRFLLTGKIDVKILEKAINRSKIDKVVYKPWKSDDLVEMLESAVNNSEIKEEAALDVEHFTPKEWDLEPVNEKNWDDFKEHKLKNIDQDKELILVVDDLPEMRRIIVDSLKRKDYRLQVAKNGNEALWFIQSEKPDLIVTDWDMPGMSGVELINDLKLDEDLKNIPVVLIAAQSHEDDLKDVSKIGASAYLPKPFEEVFLTSTVENLLRLRKSENRVSQLNTTISKNSIGTNLSTNVIDKIYKGELKIEKSAKMKAVTSLHIELYNFMHLCVNIEPVDISNILNDYITSASEVVDKYGGVINTFEGSSLDITFGVIPEVDEEAQVQNALACYAEFKETIKNLNLKWKDKDLPEFKIRSGMHTGKSLVGPLGTGENMVYSSVGAASDIAQRVKNRAEEDELLFTEEVATFFQKDDCELTGEESDAYLSVKFYRFIEDSVKQVA